MDASLPTRPLPLPAEGRVVLFDRFGGPEVLRLTREAIARPRRGEVLVRMRATSINPIDWKIRRGTMRWMSGARFPMRVGGEISGVVAELGPGVSRLRVGERVAGFAKVGTGTFAEVVRAQESELVRLEPSLPFGEAAAGLVGVTALQAVRDVARVQAGQRVLVTGASGAAGIVALQLLRRAGASVTASGSWRGIELARELGASESYDYRECDVKTLAPFDAILDFAGSFRFAEAARILLPSGVLADPVPTPARLIGQTLANLFRRRRWRPILTRPRVADVTEILSLLGRGELRVVIDETFPLEAVTDAYRRAEKGGVLGKVVVSMP